MRKRALHPGIMIALALLLAATLSLLGLAARGLCAAGLTAAAGAVLLLLLLLGHDGFSFHVNTPGWAICQGANLRSYQKRWLGHSKPVEVCLSLPAN